MLLCTLLVNGRPTLYLHRSYSILTCTLAWRVDPDTKKCEYLSVCNGGTVLDQECLQIGEIDDSTKTQRKKKKEYTNKGW